MDLTEHTSTRAEILTAIFSRSPRRQMIGRLMLEGRRTKAISFHMGISLNTVNGHIKFMYRKLALGDRAAFVLLVREVLPPPLLGDGVDLQVRE